MIITNTITKKRLKLALACALSALVLSGCYSKSRHKTAKKKIEQAASVTESAQKNEEQKSKIILNAPKTNDEKKLFEEIAIKAKQGDPKYQLELSKIYVTGNETVEPSRTNALYWMKKSLDQNYPDAQMTVGRWYAHGTILNKNSEKNIYWWEKAAEQGCRPIQMHLASMYFFGDEVEQSDKKAFYWAKKAAEQNTPHAKEQLEFFQSIVNSLKPFTKYSLAQIQAKAENGDTDFQTLLGIMYATGHGGVKMNNTFAFKWFLKAASQGDPSAQYFIATRYEYTPNEKPDYEKILFWLKKAANQGHIRSQERLYEIYFNGRGVEKNDKEAMHWLKTAVDQEYANDKNDVNARNDKNAEIKKSFEKAVDWYEKMAAKNAAGQLEKLCTPNNETKN